MRKPGAPFTFDIQEMLLLRSQGLNYVELARRFKKDRTTIMYHCKKYGVSPGVVAKEMEPLQIEDYDHYYRVALAKKKAEPLAESRAREGPINPGKSYKEYMADALKRPDERRYYEIYYTHFNVYTPNRERDKYGRWLASPAPGSEEERSVNDSLGLGVDEAELLRQLRNRDKDSGQEW